MIGLIKTIGDNGSPRFRPWISSRDRHGLGGSSEARSHAPARQDAFASDADRGKGRWGTGPYVTLDWPTNEAGIRDCAT